MAKEKTSTRGVEVETEAGHSILFENRTSEPMIPQERRFCTVSDVMRDLDCGHTTAYKVINTINRHIEECGGMTFRGRVLKKAYVQFMERGLD